jgi:3-oxoacyl-[acyl-carrier protein] reductase
VIVPFMKQQRWGRIVNITSRTGLMGAANMAHYSAAKAGLIGLTKALARELGPSGILVNAIAPTTILTPKERERLTPDRQEKIIAQIPLGRIATPDDISRVALFLGSGLNTFVNGEVITVGGGAQS